MEGRGGFGEKARGNVRHPQIKFSPRQNLLSLRKFSFMNNDSSKISPITLEIFIWATVSLGVRVVGIVVGIFAWAPSHF